MAVHRATAVFLFIGFLLTACQPAQNPVYVGAWQYTDLRLLGAADSSDSTMDLLAVYTRSRGLEEQVRLDMLDLTDQPNYDLYMAFDTRPGGTTWLPINAHTAVDWDTLIVIQATGQIQAYASPLRSNPASLASLLPQPKLSARIVRDPLLDVLTIGLNRASLGVTPAGYSLQVFIAPSDSRNSIDSLGPVRSDGLPPQPARVLFAFWNSLPAYNPAQALRRWDGAHTGPLGGRHGLSNLLHAARDTGTPLVLLDMKQPAYLSALDYVEGVELVNNMAASGMLILPETLPASTQLIPLSDWASQRFVIESRQVGLRFGLPASPFLYGLPAQPQLSLPIRLVFAPVPTTQAASLQPVTVSGWRDQLIIPILQPVSPEDMPQQATPEGPSLEVRRALAQTALAAQRIYSPERSPIMVLGGDLPSVTWGNPLIARTTFHYLAVHPWIQPLYAQDLLAIRPSQATLPVSPSPTNKSIILDELIVSPLNPLTDAAWQAYLALLAALAPAPHGMETLRAAYLGQIEPLLAAARWANKPVAQTSCDTDINQDGKPECILASENFYAVFEAESGALTYLFAITGTSPHQIIAPSSQFLTGASQPSEWDLSLGLSADPEVIPGAFSGPGKSFQPMPGNDSVTFSSPDGIRKTYQLSPSGIHLDYITPIPVLTQLPLALDPWERFSPGWTDRYRSQTIPQGWAWELLAAPASEVQSAPSLINSSRLRVGIKSSAPFSTRSFIESLPYLSIPEDPNRDYPAGNFLPFPMAVVDFSSQGNFSVDIQVVP